ISEAGSREAVEPESGEAGPGEDEEQRAAREELGDFLLLLRVADLRTEDLGASLRVLRLAALRTEALVDLGEVLGRGGAEELAAGRLGDRRQRLGIGRDLELLGLSRTVLELYRAACGAGAGPGVSGSVRTGPGARPCRRACRGRSCTPAYRRQPRCRPPAGDRAIRSRWRRRAGGRCAR